MIRYSEYMKKRFGKKVYKLSFDAGMTCPNRDGTLSDKGCIFCSEGGSGEFAIKLNDENKDLDKAIKLAKEKVKIKTKGKECLYIAYFQAYSNTYAPVKRLRQIYYPLINRNDICGLSIATRPDCINDKVLELLEELNLIKPVWIELGLQTIHESSAEFINRCYSLEIFDKTIELLNNAGLETVVHVILGLPNETKDMMLDTVKYVSTSGAKGIKLQLLHVLKGTRLGELYEKNPFPVLSLEEYTEIIKECIKILPENMIVHRLTGDGAKINLIAPSWSGDKKRVLNTINKALEQI